MTRKRGLFTESLMLKEEHIAVFSSVLRLVSGQDSAAPKLHVFPSLYHSFFFPLLIRGVANCAGSVSVIGILLNLILVFHLDFPGKGNPGKSDKHWVYVEFMQCALFRVWL